jgi:hypothetical protein
MKGLSCHRIHYGLARTAYKNLPTPLAPAPRFGHTIGMRLHPRCRRGWSLNEIATDADPVGPLQLGTEVSAS